MSETTAAVERYTPPPLTHQQFDLIERQCQMLAKSDLCPDAYRHKPANVFFAAMEGHKFGWDPITALHRIYVVGSRPTLTAEAMLGIVRRCGHKVTITGDDRRAVASGLRGDTGETHSAVFTVEMADRAGLRTRKGGPWHQYPDIMLQWRAITKLCRFLFSDVLLGMVYTPDEVGADISIDTDGSVTVHTDGSLDGTDPVRALRQSAKNDVLTAAGGDPTTRQRADGGDSDARRTLDAACAAWEAVVTDDTDTQQLLAAPEKARAWLEANTEPFGPIDEPVENAEIVAEADGTVDGYDAYAEVLSAAGGDHKICAEVWAGRGHKPVPVPELDEMRIQAKTLADEAAADELDAEDPFAEMTWSAVRKSL